MTRSQATPRCDSVRLVKSILLLAMTVAAMPASPQKSAGKEIVIHAQRFSFSPNEITLKKGETVKIILISEDVPHGLTVEGLGIQATLSKGHPAELMVTPSQTGDFSGGCSVYCGSGHRDMEMLIHVVE